MAPGECAAAGYPAVCHPTAPLTLPSYSHPIYSRLAHPTPSHSPPLQGPRGPAHCPWRPHPISPGLRGEETRRARKPLGWVWLVAGGGWGLAAWPRPQPPPLSAALWGASYSWPVR